MFEVGQTVLILPLKKSGIVIAAKKKSYTVQLNSITLDCKAADLKAIEKKKIKKNKIPKGTYSSPDRPIKANSKTIIDLHGENVDEALGKTSQFISDSIVAGLKEVTIVHGIGTGKLKRAIHEFLKNESAVKSFRLSAGNSGSTVVNL